MSKKGEKISTKRIIIVLIVITAVIFFLLSIISIGFLNGKNKKPEVKKLRKDMVTITYANKENGIKLENVGVVKDEDAIKDKDSKKIFNFTIASNLKEKETVRYETVLEKDKNCNIDNSNIKVYLEKENEGTYIKLFAAKEYKPEAKKTKVGAPKGDMVLFNGTYSSNVKDKYRLRVWIKEGTEIQEGQKCSVTVNVYAKIKN